MPVQDMVGFQCLTFYKGFDVPELKWLMLRQVSGVPSRDSKLWREKVDDWEAKPPIVP